MKESEHKANIMANLKERGYKIKYGEYIMTEVSMFRIYILFSSQSRVIIETGGSGNYYIKLAETVSSYSKTTPTKLIKQYEKYIRKCKVFKQTQ